MRKPKYKIGDIVSLITHPYTEDILSFKLSGDPQFVPPLLIIVEIILTYDEAEKGNHESLYVSKIQYKCLWYSSKAHEFEETWLFENNLKLIISKGNSLRKTDFVLKERGNTPTMGALKTHEIELGKIKVTYSLNENAIEVNSNSNTISNSLLTYLSPLLNVLEILSRKEFDPKENFFYKNTNYRRRFMPDYFVKCKWFNPGANKFSEKVFPIDALVLLKGVRIALLNKINSAITNEKILFVKSKSINKTRIIIPQSLINRNGTYLLKGYDAIENRSTEHNLLDIKIVLKDSYINEIAPTFNYIKLGSLKESTISEYIDIIMKARKNRNFIRIKYKNLNDKVSLRTLSNLKITKVVSSTDGTIHYLKAYCNSRKDERIFKLINIQRIEVLDLKY